MDLRDRRRGPPARHQTNRAACRLTPDSVPPRAETPRRSGETVAGMRSGKSRSGTRGGALRDLYGRNAHGPDRTDEGGIEIKGLPDESFAYTIQRKLA